MTNLDLKTTLKYLYAPSAKEISLVDIPPMNYLTIDGQGNPNTSPDYPLAVEALYGLAYGIRAICKAHGQVFTVMPLEGLWSFEGQTAQTFRLTSADKDRFRWMLMILQPDFVTADVAAQAQTQALHKNPKGRFAEVRFETYHEGEAVQLLHIGSYDEEGPTVARLHHYIEEQGWRFGQPHHEIYLSDPRKTAAEKLKTIIRQPFTRWSPD